VGPRITREELATMRAAVERCAELERHEETWKAELDITAAWQERATKAEAELAKVTVELDEARRMAEIRLNAIESIRHASLRATPTEGE
jgi:hypothetical protein